MKNLNNEINRQESVDAASMDLKSKKVSIFYPPRPFPYKNPADPDYPVIAYNNDLVNLINHPVENVTIEELMKDTLDSIRDCGFNASVLAWNKKPTDWEALIRTYYLEAGNRGLHTILDLSNIELPTVNQKYLTGQGTAFAKTPGGISYAPTLESYADELNRNSDMANLWGFNLMRNPEFINWGYDYVTASSDPTIFGGIKDLAAAYRVFMQNMNRHTAFLTLSVSTEKRYVGTEIYESTTNKRTRFEKYLQAVMERFNPTLMSAEIFPIIKSDSAPYFTISDWYYFTLEVIGIYSSSYDAAFWLYMPSVQFKIYRDGSTAVETEYPLPTVSMLLFQAFNALAFGFQGLVFWTYALPENVLQKDSETGALIPKKEYINAPYNDGITTNIWNNCAVAIPGIKLFGKMLLGAKFIEAAHVYGPAYVRNPYPETRQMPASGIGCVLKATATGPGVVITRLEKGSEKYVAIVNHSPEDYEDFTLTVGPGCRWTEYRMMDWSDNYLTETEHQRESQEKTVSRMLQPGSMMLIKFEWA